MHERYTQARCVAARGRELRFREIQIRAADRGIRESVVQRRGEPRIEVVRAQRLERMTVHRERLRGALVRERLGEIAKLEYAAERTQSGSRSSDSPPVERDRVPALATPVGDERLEMKDVTGWAARKRFRPRDDGFGGLRPAVVEQYAAELECEARTKRFGRPPRRVRLCTGEPEARIVSFALQERAASRSE